MTDIDEELAALYRTARAQEAPTRADRSAVQAAVATALATTALATTAQAAGGAATSQAVKAFAVGKFALWLCGGTALGVGLASAAWVATSPSPVAQPSETASMAPTSSPHDAVAPARSVSAPHASAQVEPRPRVAPSVTSKDRVAVDAAPPSLLAESDGVQRIQQALANGQPTRALSVLAEQEAQFHGGALAEERAALRVLALCAAGQTDAAQLARQRFLSTYPDSPHGARVRENCNQ